METVTERPPGKFGFRRIIVNEQAETLNKISTVVQLQIRQATSL